MNTHAINRNQRKTRSYMGHGSLGLRACCAPISDYERQNRPGDRAGFLPKPSAISDRGFALRFVPIRIRRSSSVDVAAGFSLPVSTNLRAGADHSRRPHFFIHLIDHHAGKLTDRSHHFSRLSKKGCSDVDQPRTGDLEACSQNQSIRFNK